MVYTPSLDALVGRTSERPSANASSMPSMRAASAASAGWETEWSEYGGAEGAVRARHHNSNALRVTVDPDTDEGRLRSNATMPPLRAESHLVFTELPDKGKVALYPGQGMRMDYVANRDKVLRKAATGAGVLGDQGPGLTIAQDSRPGGTTGLRVLQVDRKAHAFARGVRPSRRLLPPNCSPQYLPQHRPRSSQAGKYSGFGGVSMISEGTWNDPYRVRPGFDRPASAGDVQIEHYRRFSGQLAGRQPVPDFPRWNRDTGSLVFGSSRKTSASFGDSQQSRVGGHPAVAHDDDPVHFARSILDVEDTAYGLETTIVAPIDSVWVDPDGPAAKRKQSLVHPEAHLVPPDDHSFSWMEEMATVSEDAFDRLDDNTKLRGMLDRRTENYVDVLGLRPPRPDVDGLIRWGVGRQNMDLADCNPEQARDALERREKDYEVSKKVARQEKRDRMNATQARRRILRTALHKRAQDASHAATRRAEPFALRRQKAGMWAVGGVRQPEQRAVAGYHPVVCRV